MTPDQEKIARNSLLLASAPQELADDVVAHSHVISVRRGQMLFAEGDPATSIFLVLHGWMKLSRVTPSGSEAVVGVLTDGQSFGEGVALEPGNDYPVNAEAVNDCTLLRIDARRLLRLLREQPDVAIAMLRATYVHLHNLVAQVTQLKAQTGPQRVAEFLANLSKSKIGACALELPFDKVLIAGHLGMKPESLSRAFVKLRDKGVTIRQSHVLIDDIEALRTYAEKDRGTRDPD